MNKDFETLDRVIGKIPDFPKPGVLFYDITGILRHPEAFRYCIDRMVEIYSNKQIDAVAAIDQVMVAAAEVAGDVVIGNHRHVAVDEKQQVKTCLFGKVVPDG